LKRVKDIETFLRLTSGGRVSAIDCNGRTIWIVDAHRDDGKRFVVHADEKLTAFLELESAISHLQSISMKADELLDLNGSLKSPLCSCVSIRLPAAS
jgi:hypothetical protein